jgi:hypothetical protein
MAQCAYCQAETILHNSGEPICVECSQERENTLKPPAAYQQIRTTLLQDLVEATSRSYKARRKFEAIMGQFPSDLPRPGGAKLIENASNKLSIARKAMMKAHNRLNDYLGRGIVPEDIKRELV